MVKEEDVIALVLFGAALFAIVLLIARSKASTSPVRSSGEPTEDPFDLAALLSEQGFDVISRRERLHLNVYVGDRVLKSRYLTDCVVRKEGKLYIAKAKRTARPDQKLDAVYARVELFPYVLIYKADGVLYIEPDTGEITLVQFELEWPKLRVKKQWVERCLWFIAGSIAAILLHR